jgi:hypothetical protein
VSICEPCIRFVTPFSVVVGAADKGSCYQRQEVRAASPAPASLAVPVSVVAGLGISWMGGLAERQNKTARAFNKDARTQQGRAATEHRHEEDSHPASLYTFILAGAQHPCHAQHSTLQRDAACGQSLPGRTLTGSGLQLIRQPAHIAQLPAARLQPPHIVIFFLRLTPLCDRPTAQLPNWARRDPLSGPPPLFGASPLAWPAQ